MITAIIQTRDHEVSLAHALAALVPAATEGVIREVVVVDYGSSDGTLTVADVAGCTVVDAARVGGDPLHLAAEQARGDWLLFLSPMAVLAPGWQGGALAFIDRALVSGRGRTSVATFHRGTIRTGWLSRLLGLVSSSDGRLIAKAAYLAATSPSPASAASLASGARRGAA